MDIVIQPYDWQFRDPDVYIWGLDKESIPNLVILRSIPIFCFFELPNILWTRSMVNTLVEWFMRRPDTIRPVRVRFVRMLKLYYYNDTKYPMLLVTFPSQQVMRNAIRYIAKVNHIDGIGNISFTSHETAISPIRKLWTLCNIRPCQWLVVSNCNTVNDENKVSTLDREYTAVWDNIRPVVDDNNIVNPSILSFDIECYSDNDRIFSNPMLANHVVFMVSAVYRSSRGHISKYLITTLDCNTIDDVTIYRVSNEIELCRRFEKLVCDLNPDVVIGYNIFGYDYRYLNTRLRRRNLDWGTMGRLYNEKSELVEVGSMKHTYISMSGRISLDLLVIIRKDFKLVKYDLNTVSMEILGRGKHDVKPHEMFSIYRSRNIDDVTRVSRYCIQDAILVIDLFDKLSIWYGLVELSNVVGVPIKDLYVYGQQIRCLSQIYDLCAKNSIVIDKPSATKSDTRYKGGFVFEPKVGLHDHIICLDFKSLYPSIIQAYNICYSTLVTDTNINDSDCNIIEWDEDNVHYRYRFIKSSIRKGILPILVEKLVDERNQVRKKMESVKDTLIRNILDKRQLALKVSANAIYGFLGVSEGILSLIECAMSVTAKGRDMIRTCQQYLVSKYNANVVYGDTDSIMFSINGVDYTNINEWGKRMQSEITSLFPRPLSTEFEKAGMILCLRKKHYAFWPVGFKPGSVIYRGITLARRDKFPYHKKVYGKVIDMILTKRPIIETYDYIIESIKSLLTRQVPISDLVIVKEVGKSYKSDSYSIKIFEEKMAKQGVIINAGDRIEYVITVGKGLLGERMVLVDRYQGEPIDYYYYITNLLMKSIDNLFYVGYRSTIDTMMSQPRDYNTFLKYIQRYLGVDYIDEGYIRSVIDTSTSSNRTHKLIRSLWRYVTKVRVVVRITDQPIANFSRYIDLHMKCMQELKCQTYSYRNWLDQQSMNPTNL